MSQNAPAIPLFGDAYMADTTHLSLEEHGAYLKLMMVAWRAADCRLPNDDARLARILGVTTGKWSKLKPAVMAFWTLDQGGWSQKRLSKERAFVEEKSAKNKAAAEARWHSQPVENKQTDECERISERNAPPPPPPQDKEEDAPSGASSARQPVNEAFDVWNDLAARSDWPRVERRTSARQAMMRARLREEGLDGWRASLVRAAASPFLGASPPPEFFTFDWIVKPANFAKVIEGNYDRRRAEPGTLPVAGNRTNAPSRTLAAGASFVSRETDRSPAH